MLLQKFLEIGSINDANCFQKVMNKKTLNMLGP